MTTGWLAMDSQAPPFYPAGEDAGRGILEEQTWLGAAHPRHSHQGSIRAPGFPPRIDVRTRVDAELQRRPHRHRIGVMGGARPSLLLLLLLEARERRALPIRRVCAQPRVFVLRLPVPFGPGR